MIDNKKGLCRPFPMTGTGFCRCGVDKGSLQKKGSLQTLSDDWLSKKGGLQTLSDDWFL
jgi:hypothetical protein